MTATETLSLEIHTQNEIKRLIKIELDYLLPQLKKYIGKKIFISTGKSKLFNVEFTSAKPIGFKGGFAQVAGCRLDNSYNKLVLVFKICLNGGSYDVSPSTAYTKYSETWVELGVLNKNETLEIVFTTDEIIETHNLDQQLDLDTELYNINEYKILLEKADQAKRKINVAYEFYKYL